MAKETFSGTMENAYGKSIADLLKAAGKPVVDSLPYSGDFVAYDNGEQIRAANDWPSDKEIVTYRNAQKKAAAVQEARTAALTAAGIEKPTLENDEQLRLRQIYKALRAAKMSHEQAREMASANLGGAVWADDYGADE